MKKLITLCVLVLISFASYSQSKDSLQVQITMDTTTFKNVLRLIDENIDSRTLTGKIVKESIIGPFMNYKVVVADKPKQVPALKKP